MNQFRLDTLYYLTYIFNFIFELSLLTSLILYLNFLYVQAFCLAPFHDPSVMIKRIYQSISIDVANVKNKNNKRTLKNAFFSTKIKNVK